ncbi:MAG: hypothetical protein WC903_07445, partial [Candidatus Margulisiibacteriota bacterium]
MHPALAISAKVSSSTSRLSILELQVQAIPSFFPIISSHSSLSLCLSSVNRSCWNKKVPILYLFFK